MDKMFTRVVELQANLAAAKAAPPECGCTRTDVRLRTIRGGAQQCIRQCLDCGQPVGSAVKAVEDCLFFDQDLLDDVRREADLARKAAWEAESKSWWALYSEYLASPEWSNLRARVLKRDGGLCQGCLVSPASEVHHQTYRNFGSEFAFELVSLCRPCHDRLHQVDEAGT